MAVVKHPQQKDPLLIEDMSPQLPSSLGISLWVSLVLSGIYVALRLIFGGPVGVHILYEWLAFFGLGFLVIVASLEWVVFRQLKDLNVLNQQEIRKLKNLETYRREFLGEVSHELKTPIFAVQGFIHTLMDGAINDERVRIKFLKKAMRNADRLSGLVEDLLIITQAESGEMEIRPTHFSIYDLIYDVVDSIDYKFSKKNRHVSCRIIPNDLEDVLVYADRERIHQVMTNLVDNAIKYGGQEGEVSISIRESEGKILVKVSDNGPGIEAEHLDKIFRRFYRVDKSRSREKGGTGLGLSICKHLMEVHGEHIWVESKVGKGTAFTFSLKKSE